MAFSGVITGLQSSDKIRILGRFLTNPSLYLLPKLIVLKADPEREIVDRFILAIDDVFSKGLILDAGAGNFRFQAPLIKKGYTYESQDFDEVFDPNSRGKHTYVCDIKNIPVESGRFDVVVCTQVLEHLTNPFIVFMELSRILKPGGHLYLTTNFLFPIHGAPYDFLRFTNFALDYLAKESNFSVVEIVPRGGFFSLCGKVIFDFPAIIKSWLLFGGVNPHGQREIKMKNPLVVFLFIPFVFILDIICTLSAFFVVQLDPLDRKKRFTLGYQLHAKRN